MSLSQACCPHHPSAQLPQQDPCKKSSPSISQHLELASNGALITDQCTDQCVVITCHDPDHIDGIPCDSLYGDLPSSFLPAPNKTPAYLNCTTPCRDCACFGQSTSPCTSQCTGMQGLLDTTPENGCGTACNPIYLNECADCVVPAFLDDIVSPYVAFVFTTYTHFPPTQVPVLR